MFRPVYFPSSFHHFNLLARSWQREQIIYVKAGGEIDVAIGNHDSMSRVRGRVCTPRHHPESQMSDSRLVNFTCVLAK